MKAIIFILSLLSFSAIAKIAPPSIESNFTKDYSIERQI